MQNPQVIPKGKGKSRLKSYKGETCFTQPGTGEDAYRLDDRKILENSNILIFIIIIFIRKIAPLYNVMSNICCDFSVYTSLLINQYIKDFPPSRPFCFSLPALNLNFASELRDCKQAIGIVIDNKMNLLNQLQGRLCLNWKKIILLSKFIKDPSAFFSPFWNGGVLGPGAIYWLKLDQH